VPADLGSILKVHRRLLETLNVAALLSASKPSDAEGEEQPVSSTGANVSGGALIENLWEWSRIVDILQPQPEGSQRAKTWSFVGRIMQQMLHCELMAPQDLRVARQLLTQVSDEVPLNDGELKKVLHALFAEFESAPQLHELVASILGSDDSGADLDMEVHRRVGNAAKAVLLSFRSLRAKFRPEVEDPKSDSRRSEGSKWLSSKLSDPPSRTHHNSAFSEEKCCEEDQSFPPSPFGTLPDTPRSAASPTPPRVANAGA